MEKAKKTWPLFLIIFIIIVIVIFLIKAAGNGGDPYLRYENKLISAAKNYYKDNKNFLPVEYGEEVKIDADTLYEGEYLSEKRKECGTADVVVLKSTNDYIYYTKLDCGKDFKTPFLKDIVLEDSLVKDASSVEDGLYKIEDIRKDSGVRLGVSPGSYNLEQNPLLGGYIFRGRNPNNFISVQSDDVNLELIQIDSNGDLVMINEKYFTSPFDNSYNKDAEGNYGFNNFDRSYLSEELEKEYKALLKKIPELEKYAVYRKNCTGYRTYNNSFTDGREECSEVYSKSLPYGLLSAYQYLLSTTSKECTKTTDPACNNYNYLNHFQTWTLNKAYGNSYDGVYIGPDGLERRTVSKSGRVMPVYYLSGRILYKGGKGTKEDPYLIDIS